MAGLRERKKNATRKAITSAAVELFNRKGYDNTSLEDIANHAGIGKATVYTYFSGKGDIFLTYCDDELDDAFKQLKITPAAGATLLNQLVEFFMLKFQFITQNREFGRQLLQEMLFPKEVNEKIKEHDQRYFDYLNDLFRSAQERGELSEDQDLFLLGVHFFSLYMGVLVGWYGDYIDTLEEAENALKQLFLQVLKGVEA